MTKTYQPPHSLTPTMLGLSSKISEAVGRLSVLEEEKNLRLRRANRIRTIQGFLAIEYQNEYYQAINLSTKKTDSAPFIEFMLKMILNTIESSNSLATPKSPPSHPPSQRIA